MESNMIDPKFIPMDTRAGYGTKSMLALSKRKLDEAAVLVRENTICMKLSVLFRLNKNLFHLYIPSCFDV